MLYTVSTELYQEVAAQLFKAIGPANYFSGTIAFRFGSELPDENNVTAADCRLTASIIVCRKSGPKQTENAISELIPVWWEFHTSDNSGEQVNDFAFAALRRFL